MKYNFQEIAQILYPTLLLFRKNYGTKNKILFHPIRTTEESILNLARDLEKNCKENSGVFSVSYTDMHSILVTESSVEYSEFQNHACKIACSLVNTLLNLT